MRRSARTFLLSLAMAGTLSSLSWAQGEAVMEKAGVQPAQDQAAMEKEAMQAMAKAATPGEFHKHLNRAVGSWNTSMKMWMAPDQKPIESKGTMDAKWILGGRYVESVYKGDFMGQPFEGHGIDGYDNVAKKFVSSWIDNAGTGIMNQSGTCDAGCKAVTQSGEMMDPVTGQPVTMKQVITYADDKHFKMEMYATDPSGNSMKVMEMDAVKK
jgi:Protein of unknown function (DUF1579)